MMAPDYAHWHGMYEVAERFYQQLIPQAREIAHKAEAGGKTAETEAVRKAIDEILARPEHQWYEGPVAKEPAASAPSASPAAVESATPAADKSRPNTAKN